MCRNSIWLMIGPDNTWGRSHIHWVRYQRCSPPRTSCYWTLPSDWVSFTLLSFSFWGSAWQFSRTSQQRALDCCSFIQGMCFREWKAVHLREQLLHFPLTKGAVFAVWVLLSKSSSPLFSASPRKWSLHVGPFLSPFTAHLALKPLHQKSPFQPCAVSTYQARQDKWPVLWYRKDSFEK